MVIKEATYNDFNDFKSLLVEMGNNSKKGDKQVILAKYPTTQRYLRYGLDQFITFGVSSSSLGNFLGIDGAVELDDLDDLFEKLAKREVSGHKALATVNSVILKYPEFEDAIQRILDKKLEIGASADSVNKVYSHLIPTFDVALAYDITKLPVQPDFEADDWYWSRKMDGVRSIGKEESERPVMLSRGGNEFPGLEVVTDLLATLPEWDKFAFDGELCIVNPDGSDNFAETTSQMRNGNHVENPKYKIFDMIKIEDFKNKEGDEILSERFTRLHKLNNEFIKPNGLDSVLDVLVQEKVRDAAHLGELAAMAKRLGWEGIMIRKDVGYKGKKSQDLLKVKHFFDAEYTIEDVTFDEMSVLIDDPNKEGNKIKAKINTISGVQITHLHSFDNKPYKVFPGSGCIFTIKNRLKYQDNIELAKKELIGKVIKVQYQEECEDKKKGTKSIRFPTIIHLYEDGRWD